MPPKGTPSHLLQRPEEAEATQPCERMDARELPQPGLGDQELDLGKTTIEATKTTNSLCAGSTLFEMDIEITGIE